LSGGEGLHLRVGYRKIWVKGERKGKGVFVLGVLANDDQCFFIRKESRKTRKTMRDQKGKWKLLVEEYKIE